MKKSKTELKIMELHICFLRAIKDFQENTPKNFNHTQKNNMILNSLIRVFASFISASFKKKYRKMIYEDIKKCIAERVIIEEEEEQE